MKDVEQIAFVLARQWLTFDEPIPDFSTRFPNRLESSLKAPFQTFARKDLYKGIAYKAAVLFYFLVKNHPFQNGNKRIGLTSLLTFLALNGRWLEVPDEMLFDFTVWAARSKPSHKEAMLRCIKAFLAEFTVEWTDVSQIIKEAS